MKQAIQKFKNREGKHLQDVKAIFEKYILSDAIEKAAKAIDPTNSDKMFSHQRRVGREKATEGYELLKYREIELSKCQTFKEIIAITDKVMKEIRKLGLLWSYDTALRIGFHLKIYPTDVYMQAGVVKGYFKIFNKKPKGRKVAKREFSMLADLETYEIENFLCIWGGKRKTTIC